MGQSLDRCRANVGHLILQYCDEVRNESIQLGLVGEVAIEGEKDVESPDDGRRANAIADVGADEGKDDESGSIYSAEKISGDRAKRSREKTNLR